MSVSLSQRSQIRFLQFRIVCQKHSVLMLDDHEQSNDVSNIYQVAGNMLNV